MRRDLHGEVGLVLARKHDAGDLVQNLRQPGGVVLADGEDYGLANLAADWIAQCVLKERRAENLVGRVREEALLELTLLEDLLVVFAGGIGVEDDKPIVGQ